jgi:uncharacterized protein (TIGR02757 family)
MGPSPVLGLVLERLARRYDRRWLDSDPLRWPRAQEDPADREVVAVLAALLAYGRVASIHRSVASVLARLPARPVEALAPAERGGLQARLRGFRHRFTAGEDLAWLLEGVARARDAAGSLGAYVEAHATGPEPLRAGLAAWRRLAVEVPADGSPARRRARAFLLADPTSGAACKRTLLLARWCVRPDDGLDLGIWGRGGTLRPEHLLLPLDTHVHRVVRDLGLTRRARPDWEAAREATEALARYDASDPVRFDFALARPGIVGLCRHRHVPEVCGPCDLAPSCRHGAPRRERAAGTPPRGGITSGRRTSGSARTTPSRRRSSRSAAR